MHALLLESYDTKKKKESTLKKKFEKDGSIPIYFSWSIYWEISHLNCQLHQAAVCSWGLQRPPPASFRLADCRVANLTPVQAKGMHCCPTWWRQQWTTPTGKAQNTQSLPFYTQGTLNSLSEGIYWGHLNLPTPPVSKSSDSQECWAPMIHRPQQNLWAHNTAKEPQKTTWFEYLTLTPSFKIFLLRFFSLVVFRSKWGWWLVLPVPSPPLLPHQATWKLLDRFEFNLMKKQKSKIYYISTISVITDSCLERRASW